MTPDELNEAKYRLDRRRFVLDRAKMRREHAFLFRHSTVLITAALSLASIVVSLTAALNTYQVSAQHARMQQEETRRKADMEKQATVRAIAETERRASFELLQYVTQYYELISSGKSEKQMLIRNSMQSAFSEAALRRTFAHLAEAAPTLDAPNVWQEAQRARDVIDLGRSSPPGSAQAGSMPATMPDKDQVFDDLTGPQRRNKAEVLARLVAIRGEEMSRLLTESLLPQSDRWSYRYNLYVAHALARVNGKWPGSRDQLGAVTSLRSSGNYADPTFKARVDAAIANHRPSWSSSSSK